ncbi:CaiB/BaiF CoA transferase family protein [Priestia taiwanensis]|uniref:CoA transferase n=1 Tax=Priestia taiwanensis TaxID=1347902 RepID=A0A917AM66_9BACI|nr:CaiB/BaiF CoA-transferase family protein [Priestia taiwanensis]MBM7362249.1 crotonobetainyl-CoA:carnitine CoA-transferase CaiB-like acyl-CoA transferase [Priestia taiwanensis]GGE60645.1 CoA transferase [Priestia taiwanensis]
MLDGIRVLDFTQTIPGPLASRRLVEFGAEVIKVEPLSGDPARISETVFQVLNGSKKSVSLHLKSEQGKELARDLIKGTDIILESFRPGVMRKLGLAYEDIVHMNPSMIYVSITGYGQRTETKQLAGHDLNFMAISGLLSQWKNAQGNPIHPTITIADLIGGTYAFEKILAALYEREKRKRGSYLDISITAALTKMIEVNSRVKDNELSFLHGEAVCYHLYETKDNRYVAFAALEYKFWEKFCHEMNCYSLITQQFDKAMDGHKTYEVVKEVFKSRTWKEWEEQSFILDCCITPVYEPHELCTSPYTKENISITPDSTSAPLLGEHTKDIYRLTEEQIEELMKNKIIGG